MASFKTHFTSGIVLSVACAVGVFLFGLVPMDVRFVVLLFACGMAGAILPDMDSDSGVPFHVTFGTLAVICGVLLFLYAYVNDPGDYGKLIAYPAAAMFFIWVVIGWVFKKFTCHRGMAHSVPAALLAGLIVFSFASRLAFDGWPAFLLGTVFTGGYLLHLTLDELYAGVNFHGRPFVPNAAFGSALKFFSHRLGGNLLVYLPLISLLAVNRERLLPLAVRFIHLFIA